MNPKYLFLALALLVATPQISLASSHASTEQQQLSKAEKKAEKARLKKQKAAKKAAGGFEIDYDYDANKFNPLGIAIMNYDNDEVKRLLDSGVSASEMQDALTPLGIAVCVNNVEAVKLLLNSPTIGDINKWYANKRLAVGTMECKRPVIVDAINVGNPEVLKLILDKNPKVDFVFETLYMEPGGVPTMYEQSTPLLLAFKQLANNKKSDRGYNKFDAETQYEQLLRVLNTTANVNRILTQHQVPCSPGNKPRTPAGATNNPQPMSLMMYVNNMSPVGGNVYFNKLAIAFIDKGVKPSYEFPAYSPAYFNSIKAYINSQQIEAMKKADYLVRNVDCMHNEVILAHMLSKGWKIEQNGDKGAAFFVKLKHLPTIEMLVKQGVDINSKGQLDTNILYNNANDIKLVEALLNLGADPNLKGPGGMTLKQSASGLRPRIKNQLYKLIDEHLAK